MSFKASQVQMGDCLKVVENKRAEIMCNFRIQIDRKVLANQGDIGEADKEQKRGVIR